MEQIGADNAAHALQLDNHQDSDKAPVLYYRVISFDWRPYLLSYRQ
jgi:hypothetical protein